MHLIQPIPPQKPLDTLLDWERKIKGGPVWDLLVVQQQMKVRHIRPMTSPNAGIQMSMEMGWNLSQLMEEFQGLHGHHYRDSEWVWLQGGRRYPCAADSYLLPIDPTDGGGAGAPEPRIYLKFTIPPPQRHLVFVSVHHSH